MLAEATLSPACFFCGTLKHLSRVCPYKPTCTSCWQTGHKERDCSWRRTLTSAKRKALAQPGDVPCTCGGYSRTCPRAPQGTPPWRSHRSMKRTLANPVAAPESKRSASNIAEPSDNTNADVRLSSYSSDLTPTHACPWTPVLLLLWRGQPLHAHVPPLPRGLAQDSGPSAVPRTCMLPLR